MQKNTIIISTSVVLLASLLIYNSQKDEIENKEVTKKSTFKTIQPKKVTLIQEKALVVEEKKVIFKTKTKPEKKKFITKYSISVLPKNMTIEEKKQRFNELLVPAVEKVYAHLQKQYNEVKTMLQSKTDTTTVDVLMKSYNAKTTQELLTRLKPHPKSIALAQSAMQSGWATSRFTLIANNLFGVWSFDENEPRVQAHETRDGKAIYVKRYTSLQESIEDYYKLLATSPLFEKFREQKMKTDNPETLIKSLNKYYKDGDDYQTGLNQLIKYNKFKEYDE